MITFDWFGIPPFMDGLKAVPLPQWRCWRLIQSSCQLWTRICSMRRSLLDAITNQKQRQQTSNTKTTVCWFIVTSVCKFIADTVWFSCMCWHWVRFEGRVCWTGIHTGHLMPSGQVWNDWKQGHNHCTHRRNHSTHRHTHTQTHAHTPADTHPLTRTCSFHCSARCYTRGHSDMHGTCGDFLLLETSYHYDRYLVHLTAAERALNVGEDEVNVDASLSFYWTSIGFYCWTYIGFRLSTFCWLLLPKITYTVQS